MSAPQSTIKVCSGVRLDNRYEHSIYFPNATAQREYFAGKVVYTFSAYSYLRKSWPLEVQATMEQARKWSYLYFQNGSGKTYYYFITNVEYKNELSVILSLELDVLQTYMEEIRTGLLPCFIERQHTETDTPGEHTLEENLDIGELTNDTCKVFDPGEYCILMMCSINPESATKEVANVMAKPSMYNRIFSGIKFWAVDNTKWSEWGEQMETLNTLGVTEAIVAMWMYPKNLVKLGGEDSWDNDNLAHVVEKALPMSESTIETSLIRPNLIGNYPPKNKKLLTYPYNFILATNNQGGSAVYRYERAEGANLKFRMSGALGPEAGVSLVPMNYNNQEYAYNEGLSLGNFPTCAWNSDTYKLWLAQNQNTQTHSAIGAGLSVLAGAGMVLGGVMATASVAGAPAGIGSIAGGAGMMASGFNNLFGQLAQQKDRDIEPPQARGGFSNTNNITNGRHTFDLYRRQVTEETARVLDDFFTMYGYKVNRVQAPNINARPAFTYVKTAGCKLAGDMCTDDILAIERIFDHGITWWKNGDKVADYSQPNTP